MRMLEGRNAASGMQRPLGSGWPISLCLLALFTVLLLLPLLDQLGHYTLANPVRPATSSILSANPTHRAAKDRKNAEEGEKRDRERVIEGTRRTDDSGRVGGRTTMVEELAAGNTDGKCGKFGKEGQVNEERKQRRMAKMLLETEL